MKRQFNEFLNDILVEIDVIKEATKDISFEEFQKDRIVVRGVTRSFEIIGVAISNIPNEIKIRYNYIPWRNIKDFRNTKKFILNFWCTKNLF